jgi:hypothetical protein
MNECIVNIYVNVISNVVSVWLGMSNSSNCSVVMVGIYKVACKQGAK